MDDFTDGPETPSPEQDLDDDMALEFANFDWTRHSPPAESITQKRGSHPIIQSSPRVTKLHNQQLRSASLDRKVVSGRDIRHSPLPAVVVTDRDHNEGASASGAAKYSSG